MPLNEAVFLCHSGYCTSDAEYVEGSYEYPYVHFMHILRTQTTTNLFQFQRKTQI